MSLARWAPVLLFFPNGMMVYLVAISRIERAADPVRSKLYMTKKWTVALPRQIFGVKRLQKSASLARWRSGCRRT